MKGLLLLAVVMVTVTMSATAEAAKKDRLANLQLTTQQQASVDSVRKIYDSKRSALKNDASISGDVKTDKLKEIRKEQTAAINSVLTKEQRHQLKKASKEKAKKED